MTHLLHRHTRGEMPIAARGDGVYVIDSTGKRYLDASGGTAVSCLGHSHPRVIRAIQDQVQPDIVAMAHGLMCDPMGDPMGGTVDGARGDHVLIAPPCIIDDAHIAEIADKLGAAVDAAIAAVR